MQQAQHSAAASQFVITTSRTDAALTLAALPAHHHVIPAHGANQ